MSKNYKTLRIIYYEDYNNYEKVYNERKSSPSSVITNLEIYPFSQSTEQRITDKKFKIFLITIPEMVRLIEKIFTNSQHLEKLASSIPGIANSRLITNLIVDEIKSSNDIEGVKSTRAEINKAIRAGEKEKVRFSGIVNLYTRMFDNDKIQINELSDFRSIYDEMFADEINESDLPDGVLFRNKGVSISDKSQTYHRGDPNETIINNSLSGLIEFMNNHKASYLLKALITHYFFEYVHPFYDGNGRMGRFLLSRYLSRKINTYTGLSVSRGVLKNKAKYEDAFLQMSHLHNRADITMFIIEMLKIIIEGQNDIIVQMELLDKQLKRAKDKIDKMGKDNLQKNILLLLVQSYLFDPINSGLTNNDIYKISKRNGVSVGRKRIDDNCEKLSKEGLLVQVRKKPIEYTLSDTFKQDLE